MIQYFYHSCVRGSDRADHAVTQILHGDGDTPRYNESHQGGLRCKLTDLDVNTAVK